MDPRGEAQPMSLVPVGPRLSAPFKRCFKKQAALARAPGYWDCLHAAHQLALLLREQGYAPWIGRWRDFVIDPVPHHGALLARGLGGSRAWTTHYACIADDRVYDPAARRPYLLRYYSSAQFGRPLAVECALACAQLAENPHAQATGASDFR